MTTSFSSLPIVDLRDLDLDPDGSGEADVRVSEQLYDAFATTGFAYLVNPPLSFDHATVFNLARNFFSLPDHEKLATARKSFQPSNSNTYRGYFPTQPLSASDNLKEGFEIGRPGSSALSSQDSNGTARFNLTEPNVWPDQKVYPDRASLEQLSDELQALSSRLLALLALSLGKDSKFFSAYLDNSLSTLRLLHYPAVDRNMNNASTSSLGSFGSTHSDRSSVSQQSSGDDLEPAVKLSCTPHTDSGILTLLHQDQTGGLEVRNSLGQWIPAPYVPGSIVVNIGDLMAEVSGGRFVATMHRVRAPQYQESGKEQDATKRPSLGRLSVPFFFEPGEHCVVRSVDDDGSGHGILYGEHVRSKMKTWVEFQDVNDTEDDVSQ